MDQESTTMTFTLASTSTNNSVGGVGGISADGDNTGGSGVLVVVTHVELLDGHTQARGTSLYFQEWATLVSYINIIN